MDNWYSSPLLYQYLLENNTGACGTVRNKRKGMPTFPSKLAPGQCVSATTKDMMTCKWKDKRDVYMLSTVHKPKMTVTNKIDRFGNNVKKPQCILDYNANMGLIDKSDMQMSFNNTCRKTMKWFNRPERKIKGDFPTRLTDYHFLSRMQPLEGKSRIQKKCHVHSHTQLGAQCRKDTSFECKECGKALCLEPCFKDYHTKLKVKNQSLLKFVDTMKGGEKDHLDELLSRAIFTSATPFSIVENQNWLKFFKTLRPTYNPPSRKTISTTLLEKEYLRTYIKVYENILEAKVYAVQLDGWSNIRNESIMNIIVTTPKPFIFKSIDCGSNRHTAEYISAEISSVIEELGKEKCLGIITDNASNMKKAWKLLKADDKFKSLPIAYYSCVSHTLNLLMLDVVKVKTCFEIENISKAIIKNLISTHILKGLQH
ncbi:hypothetical protein QTP88_017372 [Uroleucon formosanum]